MSVTRREFIGTAAAAMLAAAAEMQAQGEKPLRVGLVGCGGRGTGACHNILDAAPNVELVALADLFPEKIAGTRANLAGRKDPRVKIEDARCFSGFDAYKRLFDTDVDYVMLCEPPGFRPPHFEAAVEAGKHCFLEKPGCVDPVGARRLIAAGEKAKQKNLGVHSSAENRHDWRIAAAVKQIHDGALGPVISGRVFFNTGGIWKVEREPAMSDMEWQIRNWYYFDWLSGDHIVEQHVHELDLCNWALRANPVRAAAVGGRAVRTDPVYGNIWDHFAVDYEYPNNVHILSMARQWDNTDGARAAFFAGPKGEAELYAGVIRGEAAWKYEGPYKDPNTVEHKDFIDSIRSGKPYNEARQLAESTLVAILGRTAAYTGRTVTWEQVMNSDQDYSPPKYEFVSFPMRPVPIPGKNA
jgi:predicted dehydrogenase